MFLFQVSRTVPSSGSTLPVLENVSEQGSLGETQLQALYFFKSRVDDAVKKKQSPEEAVRSARIEDTRDARGKVVDAGFESWAKARAAGTTPEERADAAAKMVFQARSADASEQLMGYRPFVPSPVPQALFGRLQDGYTDFLTQAYTLANDPVSLPMGAQQIVASLHILENDAAVMASASATPQAKADATAERARIENGLRTQVRNNPLVVNMLIVSGQLASPNGPEEIRWKMQADSADAITDFQELISLLRFGLKNMEKYGLTGRAAEARVSPPIDVKATPPLQDVSSSIIEDLNGATSPVTFSPHLVPDAGEIRKLLLGFTASGKKVPGGIATSVSRIGHEKHNFSAAEQKLLDAEVEALLSSKAFQKMLANVPSVATFPVGNPQYQALLAAVLAKFGTGSYDDRLKRIVNNEVLGAARLRLGRIYIDAFNEVVLADAGPSPKYPKLHILFGDKTDPSMPSLSPSAGVSIEDLTPFDWRKDAAKHSMASRDIAEIRQMVSALDVGNWIWNLPAPAPSADLQARIINGTYDPQVIDQVPYPWQRGEPKPAGLLTIQEMAQDILVKEGKMKEQLKTDPAMTAEAYLRTQGFSDNDIDRAKSQDPALGKMSLQQFYDLFEDYLRHGVGGDPPIMPTYDSRTHAWSSGAVFTHYDAKKELDDPQKTYDAKTNPYVYKSTTGTDPQRVDFYTVDPSSSVDFHELLQTRLINNTYEKLYYPVSFHRDLSLVLSASGSLRVHRNGPASVDIDWGDPIPYSVDALLDLAKKGAAAGGSPYHSSSVLLNKNAWLGVDAYSLTSGQSIYGFASPSTDLANPGEFSIPSSGLTRHGPDEPGWAIKGNVLVKPPIRITDGWKVPFTFDQTRTDPECWVSGRAWMTYLNQLSEQMPTSPFTNNAPDQLTPSVLNKEAGMLVNVRDNISCGGSVSILQHGDIKPFFPDQGEYAVVAGRPYELRANPLMGVDAATKREYVDISDGNSRMLCYQLLGDAVRPKGSLYVMSGGRIREDLIPFANGPVLTGVVYYFPDETGSDLMPVRRPDAPNEPNEQFYLAYPGAPRRRGDDIVTLDQNGRSLDRIRLRFEDNKSGGRDLIDEGLTDPRTGKGLKVGTAVYRNDSDTWQGNLDMDLLTDPAIDPGQYPGLNDQIHDRYRPYFQKDATDERGCIGYNAAQSTPQERAYDPLTITMHSTGYACLSSRPDPADGRTTEFLADLRQNIYRFILTTPPVRGQGENPANGLKLSAKILPGGTRAGKQGLYNGDDQVGTIKFDAKGTVQQDTLEIDPAVIQKPAYASYRLARIYSKPVRP